MAAKKKAAAAKPAAPKTTAKAKAPAKAAAKAAPAKKPAAKAAAPRKAKAITEPMNKTQIMSTIAESTGLSRKQVSDVLDELALIMEGHIGKKGAGHFTLPGLMKVTTVKKPATKARKGINPFTGEETTFKAKPASIAVKVRPLKKLKDMASA
ncbi:HU family DNA-binding protein [Isoalcanivorax beigongshangi]|uniref:Viral histone-like protein n=1 Tax=Isoalcanivorax beigongshangi TaxID=3238810 RepID=A0ABV4AHV1_9GAMM